MINQWSNPPGDKSLSEPILIQIYVMYNIELAVSYIYVQKKYSHLNSNNTCFMFMKI